MAFYRPQMLGSDNPDPSTVPITDQQLYNVELTFLRYEVFNEHDQKRSFSKEEYSIWLNRVPNTHRPTGPLENAFARVYLREFTWGGSYWFWQGVVEKAPLLQQAGYWNRLQVEIDPAKYIELLALHKGANICLRPYLPWIKLSGAKIPDKQEVITLSSDDGAGLHKPSPNLFPFKQMVHVNKKITNTKHRWGAIILPVSVNYAPIGTGFDFYVAGGDVEDRYFYLDHSANSLQDVSVSLPLSDSHRAAYALAVQRFREVFAYEILQQTQHLLETAQIDDLPMLKNAYNVMLNRIPNYYLSKVQASYDIRVHSQFDGLTRIVKSWIPVDEESGPMIDFGSEFTSPKFSEHTQLQAKSFPRFCSCATAVERIMREEMLLFQARINEIEAQIAYTMDTKAPKQQTAFLLDPSRNPYLVYDAATSRRTGQATYTDVAANLNVPVARPPIVRVGGPTVTHYEMAPAIRAYFSRTIPTAQGIAVSQAEIDDAAGAGKITTGNALPWLIGAIAAAAIVGGTS